MGFHAEAARRGYERDLISAAHTSCDPIKGADLWLYGHIYESRDFSAIHPRCQQWKRMRSLAKGRGLGKLEVRPDLDRRI